MSDPPPSGIARYKAALKALVVLSAAREKKCKNHRKEEMLCDLRRPRLEVKQQGIRIQHHAVLAIAQKDSDVSGCFDLSQLHEPGKIKNE